MLKYILCWFPMLIIAVLNGTVRDLWYKKIIGDLPAHQMSTVSLIILFGFYIWFVTVKLPPGTGRQAIYIGILWLMLTLVFEFGFGIARGNSLEKLLGDYNICKGRIWIFVLIWTTAAPYFFFKLVTAK